MNYIELISHKTAARAWEHELLRRLRELGYTVSVTLLDQPEPNAGSLDFCLSLGRPTGSLGSPRDPLSNTARGRTDLIIDLTGMAPQTSTPMLRLEICGASTVPDGLAAMLATGRLPELIARLDGVAVARAAPMLEDQVWLGRMANSVLAAASTLIISAAADFFAGRLHPIAVSVQSTPRASLLSAYLPLLAAGLGQRAFARLSRAPASPWQVAYRFSDGPGVAESGGIDGAPFTVLADDRRRFYADPFVIEHDGKHFLFVEEFPYATGKGVISVAEVDSSGHFGTPRVVLEEPHHLSYPQVFAVGDAIYMLPESSGGRELVLYRAERFPEGWRRDTVLLAGVDINDATLLVHEGAYWLVGTSRFGAGSSSDTMVIYRADQLRGPWTPHPRNPILIDRAAARPGGAFVRQGGRLMLPVQDGSRTYGGGLGLVELLRLNQNEAVWGPVRPVRPGTAWDRRGIHTLNRLGRLEVVDSVG